MSLYRPNSGRRPPGQRGFTIIELMLSIVVLAILVGVGAPALRDFVIRNRLVSQASDFTVDLQMARSEAGRRGKRIAICASNTAYDGCGSSGTAWTNGWIIFVDNDGDAVFDSGEEILRVHQSVPSGVTITLAPAADLVYYRPTGVADIGRTFTVCQAGYTGRVVTVTTTGRTTVAPTSC